MQWISLALSLCQRPSILTGKKSCYQSDLMGERGVKMAFLSITWDGTRSIIPPLPASVCVCVCQERDEERRRQLRERARQLIAEARSGVKMAELPLYTDSTSIACSAAGNNLKGRSKTAGGECRGAFIGRTLTMHKHMHAHFLISKRTHMQIYMSSLWNTTNISSVPKHTEMPMKTCSQGYIPCFGGSLKAASHP